MSWIKTLWLWEEVALCLLLGLSLVWGHMWWIVGVLVPAARDSRRCPLLIRFFFFFGPMFYSRRAAPTPRHSLWLAVPAPTGEPGQAWPGGQGPFKEQDTKTCDSAGLARAPLSTTPSGQSDTEHGRTSIPQRRVAALPCKDVARLSRTPGAGHTTSALRRKYFILSVIIKLIPLF